MESLITTMKTLLSLFIIALSLTATAQTTLKFTTGNTADVRQFADSMAMSAKHAYKFSKVVETSGYYVMKYNSVADSTAMPLIVAFSVENKGANADMQTAGTPQYTFARAFGRFLDLFPFWQRYFNPQAVAEKITEADSDNGTANNAQYRLYRQSTFWAISK
jgi:hypothetical protein